MNDKVNKQDVYSSLIHKHLLLYQWFLFICLMALILFMLYF